MSCYVSPLLMHSSINESNVSRSSLSLIRCASLVNSRQLSCPSSSRVKFSRKVFGHVSSSSTSSSWVGEKKFALKNWLKQEWKSIYWGIPAWISSKYVLGIWTKFSSRPLTKITSIKSSCSWKPPWKLPTTATTFWRHDQWRNFEDFQPLVSSSR